MPEDSLSADAYVKNDRGCARQGAQPPTNTGFCLVVRNLPRALGYQNTFGWSHRLPAVPFVRAQPSESGTGTSC